MTPTQARALLELIADLYRVAATPEPPETSPPRPPGNSHGREAAGYDTAGETVRVAPMKTPPVTTQPAGKEP